MNIKRTVLALVKKHKSYREAARATGVNFSYLCKLANGSKVNPTADTLRKLGMYK